MRPALKSGSVSLGANTQFPVPWPNRSEKLPAVVPISVVSCTDGKKAARAAPMSALAARKASSACRKSGRRASRADGRPAASGVRLWLSSVTASVSGGSEKSPASSPSVCTAWRYSRLSSACVARDDSTSICAVRRPMAVSSPAS
ncbi:hypothetical protein D9M69_585540 [compost metagenome]